MTVQSQLKAMLKAVALAHDPARTLPLLQWESPLQAGVIENTCYTRPAHTFEGPPCHQTGHCCLTGRLSTAIQRIYRFVGCSLAACPQFADRPARQGVARHTGPYLKEVSYCVPVAPR